jgi:hypothetical protein
LRGNSRGYSRWGFETLAFTQVDALFSATKHVESETHRRNGGGRAVVLEGDARVEAGGGGIRRRERCSVDRDHGGDIRDVVVCEYIRIWGDCDSDRQAEEDIVPVKRAKVVENERMRLM